MTELAKVGRVRIGASAIKSKSGGFRAALLRPELTAIVGTIVVFVFFAVNAGSNGFLTFAGTRNYLEVACEIGIVAVPVTLLLIAGEFDLSVGVMIGASGIAVAYTIETFNCPLWAGLLVGFAVAGLVGAINGLIVVRMGIPSFLVTLASMFVVKGVGLALTLILVGTSQIFRVKSFLTGDPLLPLFAGSVWGLNVSIVWWVGLTLLAAYVLESTHFGNWIYACGGDRDAALKMGVPVGKVKIILYVLTAMSATLVSTLAMMVVDQADVAQGAGKEFEAVTATVIGGAAITGGFGSPIGSLFGALMFGMVSQGFFYTDIDDNWFYAFVGAILLLAVAINKYVRQAAMRTSRSR
jgi:simple sugar transport system permease protein